MQLYLLRIALLVMLFVSSSMALADQKIKTKSNIKNDRLAESSSVAVYADAKEGSADGKTACKTNDASSTASSSPSKPVEKTKAE